MVCTENSTLVTPSSQTKRSVANLEWLVACDLCWLIEQSSGRRKASECGKRTAGQNAAKTKLTPCGLCKLHGLACTFDHKATLDVKHKASDDRSLCDPLRADSAPIHMLGCSNKRPSVEIGSFRSEHLSR